MNIEKIKTLKDLKDAGYNPRPVKDELRSNLIASLKNGSQPFEGIYGYDETVIPDLQRAILSRHNIILLGLRGQAKTRIARLMVALLDEYIPIIAGSEVNDDPFAPLSRYGRDLIAEKGDETPIAWVHRDERYSEKLATPDVSIADLIGDVDPIKAAALKLPYSDERVLHYGLIPRSHRSIFVLNELPDLQARIQVALFNILQEEDVQIRGFKMKLPLDVQFVFTANPEDYTNRGSIVTPLKDRIDSQILTHYPGGIEISRQITKQEARLSKEQTESISVSPLLEDLVETIAFEARKSEYIDEKSGVSARLSISAYENMHSAAERRLLLNGEEKTFVRVSDLYGVIPSITGKIELVYEGEQEGPAKVAQILISKTIRKIFDDYFPSPDNEKKEQQVNHYAAITKWFQQGNTVDVLHDATNGEFREALKSVPGLEAAVKKYVPEAKDDMLYLFMEFLLHGMAEHSLLSKHRLVSGVQFKDMLSSMFTMDPDIDDEESGFDTFGNQY